jgi:hypothetical protein
MVKKDGKWAPYTVGRDGRFVESHITGRVPDVGELVDIWRYEKDGKETESTHPYKTYVVTAVRHQFVDLGDDKYNVLSSDWTYVYLEESEVYFMLLEHLKETVRPY